MVAYACFVLHSYCEVQHGGVDIGLVDQQKAKYVYDDKQQRARGAQYTQKIQMKA